MCHENRLVSITSLKSGRMFLSAAVNFMDSLTQVVMELVNNKGKHHITCLLSQSILHRGEGGFHFIGLLQVTANDRNMNKVV